MFDIITIGSATKDVFLISKEFKLLKSNKFSTGMGECVALGSKIELDELVMSTGGGATNSASTFSSLGFKTAIISKIGNDISGEEIIRSLKVKKINTSLIKVDKILPTAFSALLTEKGGERTVLVHRGASSEFNERDVIKSKMKTKWIYMTSLAGNLSLATNTARHAKKNKIKVAFNPGSQELSLGKRGMESIFPLLDVLFLNLDEARLLAKDSKAKAEELCKKLAKKEMAVFITDGAAGSYACQYDKVYFARTSGAKSISRTGAGDAFGSGVVSALMKNMSMEDALRVGTLNAESVIQEHGAKNGILENWPTEIEMRKIKVKILL